MIALLPLLLLLITPLVMLVIRLWRPGFAFFWLVAAAGSLLAWPLALLGRLRIPLEVPLSVWQPQSLFINSPALLLDTISWSFSLALATLILATVLTDIVNTPQTGTPGSPWSDLAICLVITGLGMLAVLPGNLLTLLLAWALLDLTELVIWLSKARDSQQAARIVAAFSMRVAGLLVATWAGIVAYNSGQAASFSSLPPQISPFLLIAAGIRLGVLPVILPFPQAIPSQRSLRTILLIAPTATSLTLLVRAAPGSSIPAFPFLLLLAALAAIYGSLSWFSAANEMEGEPYWILGMAALAVASGVLGQPAASLAWGIAALLPGGLIFLFSTRPRWLLPILWIGALSISALPFTPAWAGVGLYASRFRPWMVVFCITQALLLAGYLLHALRPSPPIQRAERWIWIIYPWGLSLILLATFAIAWWDRPVASGLSQGLPNLIESWPAIASTGLAIFLIIWVRQGRKVPTGMLGKWKTFLSFEWLYHLLSNFSSSLVGLFVFINSILEGSAGLLWALLILILLASLFARIKLGS